MANNPRYPPEGLVPYNPAWPGLYDDRARQLLRALGDHWQIEHIGSTSVPGLLAKPVIDLALRVPEDETIENKLATFASTGWTELTALPTHRALFRLDQNRTRRAIAHLFTAEQWPTAPQRRFPAWLRTHSKDRDAYARVKQGLREDGLCGHDYTDAKSAFVHQICNKAAADAPTGPGSPNFC